MHAHDEHLLVVAAIPHADAAALGQVRVHPPHEVVVELLVVRRLVREHLRTDRIAMAVAGYSSSYC